MRISILAKICLGLPVSFILPAWSQVDPSATGGWDAPDNETRMMIPPPVSGEAYPTVVGSEMRTNYLSGGIISEAAYNDNVLPGSTVNAVSDVTYFISPTISLNQTTPRQRSVLKYTPGFRLYQHTSSLNVVNQSSDVSLGYRLSPYTAISLQNTFQQNSNAFNQPYLSGTQISGSTQSPVGGVIAPYANTITEMIRGGVSYQFGRNGMIGGAGNFALLNYPNPEQATGLYNSKSIGGSAFYSRRLSSTQYLGGTYHYTRTDTTSISSSTPSSSTSQVNGVFLFYTLYLKRSLSISLSAGAQHLDSALAGARSTTSWAPGGMASMGWQANHFNFAASYSQTVSAGNGLLGAFNLTNANATANWQVSRNWSAGLTGAYMNTMNATPLIPSPTSDGHSITGSVLVQRKIGEHIIAMVGYSHLHQHYDKNAAISSAPDNNREYLSIAYTFTRPLGR